MSKLVLPVGERDHIRGDADAPTVLVEYGDFECPHCGDVYPVIREVLEEEKDNLMFVYRNFPLEEIHPRARHAAFAAESAGLQGKFWQMHDVIYENQDELEDENLISYAEKLRLDMGKFIKDFESEKVAKKVDKDFASGMKSGVNGTPTLFINNIRYDDVIDYNNLLLAIEEVSREENFA